MDNTVVKTTNSKQEGYGQNFGFGINPSQINNAPQMNRVTPNLQDFVSAAPQQPQPVHPFIPNAAPTPMMQNPQQMGYNPMLGPMINPMVRANGLPYIPHYNTFSQFVDVVNPTEAQCNTFNPNGLIIPAEPAGECVGLPMDGLIESATYTDPYATTVANFDGLVKADTKQQPQEQKFGVQAYPTNTNNGYQQKASQPTVDTYVQNSHINKSNQPAPQSTIPGRKLNNWFTRLLEQRGQDYITSGKLTIDEISKNAERILDDMIAGRIDYTRQGNDIINPIVIETLINYCSNKLAINKSIQFCLGYVYNDYTNKQQFANTDPQRYAMLNQIDDALARNITQAIAIENQDIGIYQILYDRLMYVNASKNASSLFSLTTDLNNYKKAIKKRY